MQSIKVKSPATLSNLCCGFDILGMALQSPYDEIELIQKEEPGIVIKHLDNYELPLDPLQNISGVALQALMNAMNYQNGFEIIGRIDWKRSYKIFYACFYQRTYKCHNETCRIYVL